MQISSHKQVLYQLEELHRPDRVDDLLQILAVLTLPGAGWQLGGGEGVAEEAGGLLSALGGGLGGENGGGNSNG